MVLRIRTPEQVIKEGIYIETLENHGGKNRPIKDIILGYKTISEAKSYKCEEDFISTAFDLIGTPIVDVYHIWNGRIFEDKKFILFLEDAGAPTRHNNHKLYQIFENPTMYYGMSLNEFECMVYNWQLTPGI